MTARASAASLAPVLALLLTLAADVPAAPLAPADDWTLSSEPTRCMVTRRFGPPRRATSLSLGLIPLAAGHIATLVLPDPVWVRYGAAIRFQTGPAGAASDGTVFGFTPATAPQATLSMYVAPETLAPGSETVAVEARGQRIAYLTTGDLGRAAALLADCERDLLDRLGVDSAAAAIPIRARVRGDRERWLMADDYPTEALRAGEQGRVGVRLDLDADGVVVGCTPVLKSGRASLDAGTCGPLITRAHYFPARDSAGGAIPSSQLFFTNWQLP